MNRPSQRSIRSPLAASCLFLLSMLCVESTRAIDVGTSSEAVRQELGSPRSFIQIGDRQVLYYERGHVIVEQGAVVEFELISEEEAALARHQREEALAEQQARQREAALARFAEGTQLRDEKLEDPAFMASSAARRVAYWRAFKERYPKVQLGIEYEEALRELEQERLAQRAEARELARIQRLEQRVLDAERRAVAAEAAAERNRYQYGWDRHSLYPYPTVSVVSGGARSHHKRSRVQQDDCDDGGSVVNYDNPVQRHRQAFQRKLKRGNIGYVRPRGGHNSQVHNRALRPGYLQPTITPYNSIGGYASQRESTHSHSSTGSSSTGRIGYGPVRSY